jgi:hypothetical protein
MIRRAVLHVAGPPGAGKTTFVTRLLAAVPEMALCMRARREPRLRRERVTSPKGDPELRRYREAGAGHAVRYDFPAPPASSRRRRG